MTVVVDDLLLNFPATQIVPDEEHASASNATAASAPAYDGLHNAHAETTSSATTYNHIEEVYSEPDDVEDESDMDDPFAFDLNESDDDEGYVTA